MRKVKIITDSCSDLSLELLEKYDIDYAKMSTVYDGKDAPALLEWSQEEVHTFYNIMREGNRITTAQVSVEEFRRIFQMYLDRDCDIVYIACSSKQSGSVNTGHMVSQKLLPEYPGARIICIDSLNASLGEGILAIEAAKLAAAGKTAEEIAAHILSVRKKVQQYVTVHSLDALRRAGRVTASSAFLGNLMGVKPILISDAAGTQVAYKKVKGRQNSLKELVAQIKENCEDLREQTVYIAHADCPQEEVNALRELAQRELGCKEIFVGCIGPIIGASIGPDAFGIWAFGREVTFRAEGK